MEEKPKEQVSEEKEPVKKGGKGKKTLLIIIGVLILLVFIGGSGDNETTPTQPQPQQPEAVEESETQEVSDIQEEKETEPFTLEGVGQKATEKFTLTKGLAVFEMTHTGSSNFIVDLLDDTGTGIELLVNEIGTFDGSKAVKIPRDGVYLLDVTADGQWTVNIK